MTVVERLRQTGIRRLGSMKAGFHYRGAGGAPARRDLKRIEELRIPPAWQDVAVARSPRAAVQAVGRDAAGRWQYLYHPRAVARREKKKAERLRAFIRALPALRRQVARDLAASGLESRTVMACIVRILATCFLRPGSDEYASENGSYGIATLRRQHVAVRGSRIRLHFAGKGGKEQDYELEDRRAARVLRALLRQPGRRVFRVRDAAGDWRDVHRSDINAYIKEVMGEQFSAKDFRTWAGTAACACALARAGFDEGDSAAQIRRKITAAVKETAAVLGNTPAVCRSAYISPLLLKSYESGRVLVRPLADIAALARLRGGSLHPCERALLRLLEEDGPRRGVTKLAA